MDQKPVPTRGRPKLLDREQVLQTALIEYWAKGPTNVSIGEICKQMGASKPGVYREFGSDDGLKSSVLEAYRSFVIQPLIDIIVKDQPAAETIDAIIGFMTQDRTALGIPDGCLFVMMRAQSEHLGPSTCDRLNKVRHDLSAAYSAWIERAKLHGEFIDIPTDIAVLLLDMQHGGAMRMQREGVPRETIESVLRFALGALMALSEENPL
jgi:AcrR family transcriptional regulator